MMFHGFDTVKNGKVRLTSVSVSSEYSLWLKVDERIPKHTKYDNKKLLMIVDS